jgi:hypothetical protein
MGRGYSSFDFKIWGDVLGCVEKGGLRLEWLEKAIDVCKK